MTRLPLAAAVCVIASLFAVPSLAQQAEAAAKNLPGLIQPVGYTCVDSGVGDDARGCCGSCGTSACGCGSCTGCCNNVWHREQLFGDWLGVPHARQYAILALTKLGDENDLSLIRSMLDDSGVVASHHRINNMRITTQVRDIALAALIHHSGGAFKDYGMPGVGVHPTNGLTQATVGFPTEDAREKAISKWKKDWAGSEAEAAGK